MRFISFTSGSCGNCYWLGPDADGASGSAAGVDGVCGARAASGAGVSGVCGAGAGILIDAGASMRRVKKVMLDNGLSLDDISAILVTHDHLDHIHFLGTFCKYRRPKVCTTAKLHGALARHTFTRDHIGACRHVLQEGEWNEVNGYKIRFFEVPHDATQTVGYAVVCPDGHLFVLMTDLEHVPAEAMALAKEADTVVIESNYDYDMLVNGPYPPELKQRILKQGHLCNDDTAAAIREFWHPGLKNLFLCHLSGNNNTPRLAYDCASAALGSIGVEKGTVHLRTLERGKASPLINL